MREWQELKPMGEAPPPRGIWILAHEPVPDDRRHLAATPITSAWFGSNNGLHERDVDKVQRLRANVESWRGRPYHRWGWVDLAQLVDEPVYYLEFSWGGLYGYGIQAAVTARGLVLTSAHLWRS
jgi:hypothetical protein